MGKSKVAEAADKRLKVVSEFLGLEPKRYNEMRDTLSSGLSLQPELISRLARCDYDMAVNRIRAGLAVGVLANQRGIGVAQPMCADCLTGFVARYKLSSGATTLTSAAGASQQRRDSIPAAVRLEVWRRDGGFCTRCGGRERLEYDHIVPASRGGSNTARNIELLCQDCNRKKGAHIGG
jgi:hypothetical protein